VIREVVRRDEQPDVTGPFAGDLYLDPVPGIELRTDLDGPPLVPYGPRGAHRFDPSRPDLWTVFAAGWPSVPGPAVSGAVAVDRVRNIDVAPTIAAWLGLQPPREARGRPIRTLVATAAPR
jgi:hypothetical protein